MIIVFIFFCTSLHSELPSNLQAKHDQVPGTKSIPRKKHQCLLYDACCPTRRVISEIADMKAKLRTIQANGFPSW